MTSRSHPPRRAVLAAAGATLALALGGGAGRSSFAMAADWATFKRRFVQDPGRVVDTGNNGVSHSESQGWGMLFAEHHDDRQTFERLWTWTAATLRRPDKLFSWRFVPGVRDPVADKNNASDGDILIAWALSRAAIRWNEPRYAAESRALQIVILNRMIVDDAGSKILLPGVSGFQRGERWVVNLSYYVWPAFQHFAATGVESRRWLQLEADGLKLLDRASFGAFGLPPDWALVGKGAALVADDWPPYFGFDAVRVPLYLAWGNHKQRLGRYIAAWQAVKVGSRPPAWIDLRNGALSSFPGSEGVESIFTLISAAAGVRNLRSFAPLNDGDDYYSASLKMLVDMAARETASLSLPPKT